MSLVTYSVKTVLNVKLPSVIFINRVNFVLFFLSSSPPGQNLQ